MLTSMTGFGKAERKTDKSKIQVEIKALNSKFLDLNIKLPQEYKAKEMGIRTLLSKHLVRGKIELSVCVESEVKESLLPINKQLVTSYYKQLKAIADELGESNNNELLPLVMRMPETMATSNLPMDEAEWESIMQTIEQAVKELVLFRQQEGKALAKDINARICNIEELLGQVQPFEQQRVNKIEERIKTNLRKTVGAENIDNNRLEQELIYYMEKLDITEEKVRLKNHCKYFLQTTELQEANGKKLGFITQEIGREINTLGSKANDSDIQRIVILMKDELEKIKEQLLNVL